MPENTETTYIKEVNMYRCNFCGAFAIRKSEIDHYSTCTRDKGIQQYEKMFEEI